ncbi:MAG: DUF2442 domain-containing protein [Nitrospira sp.]|nr:DUF2442 domain-containing protein [Nitrospira sp.]
MHPAVVSVECKEDYILSIVFDNGEYGLLDMKPYLNLGVFKKIQNPGVFETVYVSFDTIAWESGADLDPEFVYEKCRIVQQSTSVDGAPRTAADAER